MQKAGERAKLHPTDKGGAVIEPLSGRAGNAGEHPALLARTHTPQNPRTDTRFPGEHGKLAADHQKKHDGSSTLALYSITKECSAFTRANTTRCSLHLEGTAGKHVS